MKLDPHKALVVLSGGQDSTTCLGWALHLYNEVQCVTIDYGQKHSIELEAAKNVVAFFEKVTNRKIPHEIISLPEGVFAGTSPLTNKDEILETYSDYEQMEDVIGSRIEKTFVPMRNAVFLMLAANRAAVTGARTLITGVCMMDNANYPDCRPEFITCTEFAINTALGLKDAQGMTIQTPLMRLDKADSVKWAWDLPFTYSALAYSHTAYDGVYPPIGSDHASVLRAKGFEQAGLPDPLVVRAVEERLMDFPSTDNYSDGPLNVAYERLRNEGILK